MMRLLCSAFVLVCFVMHTHCGDQYTDQNRPYEFGFKIDGQQHRHEKKDKNGIIMGEFGFITADDVYHVTVYATDAQGHFKILSMKNIHLKNTKSVTSVRQGHSLQIPSTHQVSAVQVTTTTTARPVKKIAQGFQPVSLEAPVNSCSHCSLPTTSTVAPKTFSSINQPNANNNYNTPENSAKPGQKTKSQTYPSESNNYSPKIAAVNYQQNSPSVANEGQVYPQNAESPQNYPAQNINTQYPNYPSVSTYQSNPTTVQNNPLVSGTQQSYTPRGLNGEQITPETKQTPGDQKYTQETQKNTLPQGAQNYLNQQQNYAITSGTPQNSAPQKINGEQNYQTTSHGQSFLQATQNNNLAGAKLNYPPEVGTQQNYQPNSESNQYSRPQEGILQPTKEQTNSNSLKSPSQTGIKSNVGSIETNNQGIELPQKSNEQTPKEISPGGNVPGYRKPKQFNERIETGPVLAGQKPTLAYAQMQIVDKNTNIHAKSPGEKEGLPPGLTENDMVRLLYTFNYTLGFQGHFEEGYSNGVKQGYYFVTGRNGVRTRIDYVADDKGFHPKISQDVLDLLSDDVPKPETEKEAKYGLKGYEFKWLYFPLDSSRR